MRKYFKAIGFDRKEKIYWFRDDDGEVYFTNKKVIDQRYTRIINEKEIQFILQRKLSKWENGKVRIIDRVSQKKSFNKR